MDDNVPTQKPYRTSGTIRAEVIQVIRTKTAIGTGFEDDPVRELIQYWNFDGRLLASSDPVDTTIS